MPEYAQESSSEDDSGSSSNDSADEQREWVEKKDPPAVRSLMLAFMFMFQGYGAMVGNPQHALKHKLGVSPSEDGVYQDATASFQLAKLVMRIAQIAFLVFLPPRGVVIMAYVVMMVALLVPLVFVWGAGVTDFWVVYLQYSLGGIAVGLFEGTFLSVISSLGKNTKTFAIMGAPLGFAMMNIVLGTFSYWHMPTPFYYIYGFVCLPIAIFIFVKNAPRVDPKSEGKGCQVFVQSMKKAHIWLPKMVPWFIAKFVGNFVLEDAFPLFFNTYTSARVPIFGPNDNSHTVPIALYLAWYWFPCMALGDTISRRLPNYIPLQSFKMCIICLIVATVLCIGGESLDFLKIGIVNGLAVFISNFGNGFIYGLSAKYIDGFLAEEHRYAAYNLWCFVGDLGGYAGQCHLSKQLAQQVCGGEHYKYLCTSAEAQPTTSLPAAASTAAATTAAGAATSAAPTVSAPATAVPLPQPPATSLAPPAPPAELTAVPPPPTAPPLTLPTVPPPVLPTIAPPVLP